MSKILLGPGVRMDLDELIASRLLIQANSGGGKSYTIRRFIEQSFGEKQIIVLDPEGEFGNMRTKYDFVYCGKGGDAPVESRSAALLAHRLLELKASAIIDLYELPPQERKHFVRLFCEALVNAPKELWHDVFIIVDEAHVFAPEKDQSESLSAIIDLASRGRKRGYCAILATQRPAKLNKDAAAECNNKLIGMASLDIDRKRAADELGFSTKESVLSLRDLSPGEFYAFGPAISREVTRVTIADVTVKPAKRGVSRGTVPAPSATVKKLLAKLADIPQEAQKEATTAAELKTALSTARAEITRLTRQNATVAPSEELQQKWYDLGVAAVETSWRAECERIKADARKSLAAAMDAFNKIHKISGVFVTIEGGTGIAPEYGEIRVPRETVMKRTAPGVGREITRHTLVQDSPEGVRPVLDGKVGAGEMASLKAIASYQEGITRVQATILTGYKRSTRDAYIQRLIQRGYAVLLGDRVRATFAGIEALGSDYEPVPTDPRSLYEYYLGTLPAGEAKALGVLYDQYPKAVRREFVSDMTGFKRSTRDAYLQRLIARQLVTDAGQSEVRASDHLFTNN